MRIPGPDGQELLMRRVVRRETTSSRSGLAVLAAALVILLAIYALLESILRAAGQPPWLLDPRGAVNELANLPDGVSPALLASLGVVLLLLGLLFFLNAVVPGRRARRTLGNGRIAVVVDDEVLAAALARRARLAAGVIQEQVLVVVSRSEVVVNVRPTSGMPLNAEAVEAAVEDELSRIRPTPYPSVTVRVASSGVVGV